jgi:arginine-tRNA-protein transferase
MIYSFYEPDHDARSGLGNFIILDHIRRAREAGLAYV